VSDDDHALLTAWRAGDRGSGDVLVRRHYSSVLRFFQLKITASADDLAQRTFLACLEVGQQYRGEGSFRSYLFGIANKQLLKHLEKESRSSPAMWADAQATRTSLSTVMARREEEHLLLRGLAALPLEFQTALGLYYFEGLAAREIGDALQIPTSTVTSRLAKGRQLLRSKLRAMAGTRPAGVRLLADPEGVARALVREVPDVPRIDFGRLA
jgi:RNA polymerase sigma-70 factor (ECF subfamily)